MNAPPAYDSFREILGVATSERTSAVLTPRALNMEFRDSVRPRWGVWNMETVFADEADRDLFENGVIQKFHAYQPYERRPGALVLVISGTVFLCRLAGMRLYVSKLFTGLRADATIAWACNAFEWLVIQNGFDAPVIWDGRNAAFQSDPTKQEMPIGGPMCFIHHSIAVASADGTDKIAVSDRWRATESDNVWRFTNTQTWDDAGVFGLHVDMGKIMALVPMPQIKNTPNGQGELIILGTRGAQSLNLQAPRADWIDSQIQDTVMTGVGLASYLGALSRTSIWFIGHRGLYEFKRIQSNIVRNEALTPESADIDFYWQQSNSNLRITQPLGYHDDRILLGLYPEVVENSYGAQRCCRAWASYDLTERWRNGNRLPKAWHGLQCGIRPIEWANLLVNRTERTYAVSRDVDGKNRVYEMTNHAPYDVIEGRPRTIVSFFDTPPLAGRPEQALYLKKPDKLRVDFDNARTAVQIDVDHRAEQSRSWAAWGTGSVALPEVTDCAAPHPPFSGTVAVTNPEPSCSRSPAMAARARIRMHGHAEVTSLLSMLTNVSTSDGFPAEVTQCQQTADSNCEKLELY